MVVFYCIYQRLEFEKKKCATLVNFLKSHGELQSLAADGCEQGGRGPDISRSTGMPCKCNNNTFQNLFGIDRDSPSEIVEDYSLSCQSVAKKTS